MLDYKKSPGGVCTLHTSSAVASTEDGHVSGPAMRTGTDVAAPARCKQVRCGYQPGTLDCVPRQRYCLTGASRIVWGGLHGHKDCLAAFGTPSGKATTECPDGGIGSRGVADTSWGVGKALCMSWDSSLVTSNFINCDNTANLCTKAASGHGHEMSKRAGVFVMKRMACADGTCKVYKAGKCFDVGEDVSSSTKLDRISAANIKTQNKVFATKVLEGLNSGLSMTCDDRDAILAAGIIKIT